MRCIVPLKFQLTIIELYGNPGQISKIIECGTQGGAAKKKIGHGVEFSFKDQVGRTN